MPLDEGVLGSLAMQHWAAAVNLSRLNRMRFLLRVLAKKASLGIHFLVLVKQGLAILGTGF